MSGSEPGVGDEVLIRGRVKQYIPGVGAQVELFSKTDQYPAWVRPDLIEQVIPADQTRTFSGFTVRQTREAIVEFSRLIDEYGQSDTPDDPLTQLVVASLEGARAELVAQLEAIGVPVKEQP